MDQYDSTLDIHLIEAKKVLADTRSSQTTINSRIDDDFAKMAANIKSYVEAAVSSSSVVVDRTAVGSVHSSDVADTADDEILGSVAQDGTSVVGSIDAPGDEIADVVINAVNNTSANSVVTTGSVHSGHSHSQRSPCQPHRHPNASGRIPFGARDHRLDGRG